MTQISCSLTQTVLKILIEVTFSKSDYFQIVYPCFTWFLYKGNMAADEPRTAFENSKNTAAARKISYAGFPLERVTKRNTRSAQLFCCFHTRPLYRALYPHPSPGTKSVAKGTPHQGKDPIRINIVSSWILISLWNLFSAFCRSLLDAHRRHTHTASTSFCLWRLLCEVWEPSDRVVTSPLLKSPPCHGQDEYRSQPWTRIVLLTTAAAF